MGYHPETLMLYVGDVQLKIHPDQFIAATWSEGEDRRLKLAMGNVQILFRAAPATG